MQRYKELSQNLYLKERVPSKYCKHNMWILKPANMNQGQGINIITNIKELKIAIDNRPLINSWVIQKYIERPLLYLGRKFDIRVWIAVTDNADVFMYKDGYIRTSSEEYIINSRENFIHLTNNCLQVNGANYSKYEPGNTLSLEVLKELLSKVYENCKIKPELERDIIGRIKDLVIDTIMAIKSGIVVSGKKKGTSFELLGYDFIVDEDLRTWLIEVNTNPYLGVPNTYIKGILPKMLDDLLEVVIDPSSYRAEDNRFEIIYCEKQSKYSKVAINQRRDFDKIYPLEELKPIKKQSNTKRQAKQLRETLVTNLSLKEIEVEKSVVRLSVTSELKENEVKKPVRVNLEELVVNIIKNNNYSKLTLVFEKLMDMIKKIALQGTDQESKELSIIGAMNAMMKSPMISSFLLTNSTSIPNLLETILDLNNTISTKFRLFLVLF